MLQTGDKTTVTMEDSEEAVVNKEDQTSIKVVIKIESKTPGPARCIKEEAMAVDIKRRVMIMIILMEVIQEETGEANNRAAMNISRRDHIPRLKISMEVGQWVSQATHKTTDRSNRQLKAMHQ